MAFDEDLAARVREVLEWVRGVEERRMFGSLCFLLHGNLLVGVWHYALIARLGPDRAAEALREPHIRRFDVTGRPMKGWVLVGPERVEEDARLLDWIDLATNYVGTLPPK